MRILYLGQEFPWPANMGARQRAFHVVRALAERHEVEALALNHTVPPPELEREFLEASGCSRTRVITTADCNYQQDPAFADWPPPHHMLRQLLNSPLPMRVRRWRSPTLTRELGALRESGGFDLVWAVRTWMAEQAYEAGFPRVVVDVDDLGTMIEQQALATSGWYKRRPVHVVEAWKTRVYERRLPRRYAAVVIAKDDDRGFFPHSLQDRVHVVPNGVRVPPHPAPEPARADGFLFVGTLGYWPNADAIGWFAGEVMPRIWEHRPDARFDVAGLAPVESVIPDYLADPRCTLHVSPPDLAPLYADAAVVVTPVRLGGGTRIKILEALGQGKPVVSTTFGAEGLGLEGGVHLAYADDPDAMAAECLRLLDDPARRAALGAAGRELVSSRYNWALMHERIEHVVQAARARTPERPTRAVG